MAIVIPNSKRGPTVWLDESVEINWATPHSTGLLLYLHLNASGARDLVTGVPLAPQNGCTLFPTARGYMADLKGANQGLQGTATGNHFTFPGNNQSILWAGRQPVAGVYPDTNTRLGGISYDSSTVSPYDVLTIEPTQFFTPFYPNVYWNSGGSLNGTGQVTYAMDVDTNFISVVGTVNTTHQQLFVNGIRGIEGFASFTSIGAGTSPQIIFGTYPGQTFNSHCDGQCLMIWDRELTQTEIRDLYYFGSGLVLKNSKKFFLLGGSGGVARALTGTIGTASELKASMGVNYAVSSKVYSDSQINVPILYKSLALNSTSIYAASEVKTTFGLLQQMVVSVMAQSNLSNTIVNTVPLSVRIYSASSLEASLARLLVGGIYALNVRVIPHAPTSYLKGGPRPIAYLKNDNDNTGVTNETIQQSPDDYQFP